MQITLIENGFDFIMSALEHARLGETGNLKYTVLHLSNGVELILKEKLRTEHWSLLFADINKANEDAFKTGDFKSVDFDDCITRLEKISKVNLESHVEVLRKIRRVRNRLQHFEYKGSRDEVIPIIVKTWSFVLDFIHDYLPHVVTDQNATIDKIRQLMIENEDFVTGRFTDIQPEVEEFKKYSNAVLECPHCLENTLLIPGGENPHCLFCRYSASAEEVCEDWCLEFFGILDPKEESMYPHKFTCPSCGSEMLVQQEFGGMYPPDPGWVCFYCGETWDYDDIAFCSVCGRPYHSIDDGGICSDCIQEQMRRD